MIRLKKQYRFNEMSNNTHKINFTKEEFKSIVEKHILSLLGMSHCSVEVIECEYSTNSVKDHIVLDESNKKCTIYSNKCSPKFRIEIDVDDIEFDKSFAEALLSKFLDSSINKIKQNKYFQYCKDNLYLGLYELAICEYLGNNCYHKILSRLKRWAMQTYEGEPVQLALYMTSKVGLGTDNYLNFLDNKYGAVLTNCTETAALVDGDGNLYKYISIKPKKSKGNSFVPYFLKDFSIITEGSYEEKTLVGFVLLETGEILIIKKNQLKFVFRDGKWIFFDQNKYFSRIYKELTAQNKEMAKSGKNRYAKFAKSILESLIDVSFARTGGCLAIVRNEQKFTTILGDEDQLDKDTPVIESTDSEEEKNNKRKKILKKNIIKRILKKENSNRKKFYSLDRSVRKELLSLDGAVILTMTGKIISAGAIVKVESGSSGGGRTQAAKSLACMGRCMGIKISEDGYVEAYKTVEEKAKELFRID